MECPVPRTSRFAVSRLLRFSVNSRRQPVTARPVHHRCACRGSVRLSVAGAPVYLPGAGAPVCLWIINPLAGGRSPTHSRIFGALAEGWPPARLWIIGALAGGRSPTHSRILHALLKLRCTWKPFSRREMVATCTEVHKVHRVLQAHQRSPSARRFAKRIAALLVHRRSSRAPMIVKRTYITFFHPTFRVLTTLFHHVIGCFTTFFHPIFDRVATLFQHSFSLLDCVFHLGFASAGCVFQHTHERPRRK